MKIGIVIPSAPAYSETFFNSKIKGLLNFGHEVVLFTNHYESLNFNLCKIVPQLKISLRPLDLIKFCYYFLYKLMFLNFNRLIKFFVLERNDGNSFRIIIKNIFINIHLLTSNLDWLHFGYATMTLRRDNVARSIGARMAVSLRGFDIAIYPILHLGCYNTLWSKIDKVHTISDDLLRLAFLHGLPFSTPFSKITPAIDVQFFNDKNRLKKIDKSKIVILTVARLHWKKGLEYSLEALHLLRKQGINFVYKVIGDGQEYERLKFASFQLGLSDNVEFVGKLSAEKIKLNMQNSDIYLQYSISEGFCNSVLEAQAMGLLCIVSDAEGLAENVLDNITGWVIKKRAPELLANKIMDVLNSSDSFLDSIRDSAKKRVQEQFSIELQKVEFCKFYQ